MHNFRSLLLLAFVCAPLLAACSADGALRHDYTREMDGCVHGCD